MLPQQRKLVKDHLRQHFKPAVANRLFRLIEDDVIKVRVSRGQVIILGSDSKQRVVMEAMLGAG